MGNIILTIVFLVIAYGFWAIHSIDKKKSKGRKVQCWRCKRYVWACNIHHVEDPKAMVRLLDTGEGYPNADNLQPVCNDCANSSTGHRDGFYGVYPNPF